MAFDEVTHLVGWIAALLAGFSAWIASKSLQAAQRSAAASEAAALASKASAEEAAEANRLRAERLRRDKVESAVSVLAHRLNAGQWSKDYVQEILDSLPSEIDRREVAESAYRRWEKPDREISVFLRSHGLLED